MKTLSLTTRTSHPEVQHLVANCLEIVKLLKIEPKCGPYFCWPLAILSCAVETTIDMSFLKETLEKVWLVSFCGEVQRVRKVTEVLWEARKDYGAAFNSLDVLVQAGGIFRYPYLELR